MKTSALPSKLVGKPTTRLCRKEECDLEESEEESGSGSEESGGGSEYNEEGDGEEDGVSHGARTGLLAGAFRRCRS